MLCPDDVKKLAKQVRKETGESHCRVIEKIVRAMGFRSYNAYLAKYKEMKNEKCNEARFFEGPRC
jgi:hypothetical protein